jgi:hypothetical protein
VVLVTPPDRSDATAFPSEVVIPTFQKATDGSSGDLFPYRVTWSPDGEYLLYQAWSVGRGAPSGSLAGLVAVPVDPDLLLVVLAQENVVPYDGYPDTTLVPIQTWGRSPSD